MEHLGQWRRAGAECQHRRKGVELRLHPLGEEIGGKLRLDDLEASVDQPQTPVDAVHGAADIAGAFAGNEIVKQGEGLDFAARHVQKGRAENVHPLHVDGRLAGDGFAAGCCCEGVGIVVCGLLFCDARWCVDQMFHFPSTGGR